MAGTRALVWAEVVHGTAAALPVALRGVVDDQDADPVTWTLDADASSEQVALFLTWRTGFVDTLLVGPASDALVASAWLRRRGASVDLTADRFVDQAAAVALWWAAQDALPALPAFATLTRNLQAVADLVTERQRGVTFRVRADLAPTHRN